ncbi:hypothetical protein Pcinc_014768 [Petrolisthes cinctipes]|uniref:NudC domain-containing protein 1 n=1 Tax=Petrolisthes cinctipes TaxID=88211 RepID=A0AAE1FUR3_PETCI|nr:hypothetical protein Pcinc_014768 [Petrolisthes cinctipes]
MAKIISLTPDSKLMNPDFEGYKLYYDADVTTYKQPVLEGVEVSPSGPTCYLGTRLKALHNHLFPDPFHLSSVYYFTSRGHLIKSGYSQDCHLSGNEVVWQADLTDEKTTPEQEEDEGGAQYHATVSFPGADLALVSNGRGSLHLLHTADRTTPTTHSWRVDYEVEIERGVLLQSCVRSTKAENGERADKNPDGNRVIECVVLSITTPAALLSNPQYTVVDKQLTNTKAVSLHLLTWLNLTYNGSTWKVSRERTVAGEGDIHYCSIDGSGTGLIVLAHKNYSFVGDSECPIIKPNNSDEKTNDEEELPKYIFMQTDEDVTVWMCVGEVVKEDVCVKVTSGELSVKVKERDILHAHFTEAALHQLSTWTIDGDGRLEIVLPKVLEGERWESLFMESELIGEEVKEQHLQLNKRLAHLTSDQWNPDPSSEAPVYDPGELEACDQAREELTLTHLHGSTHTPIALVHLGPTQHLFNAQIESLAGPAFCLRHDVDALLWQPRVCSEGQVTYTHVATYDAFGYVRASKTSAKFTCASSDLSYVAVADTHTHVYVFCQPGCVGSGELRNRKSGRQLERVARQLVISLKNHDPILGLHTAPGSLYVLTATTLYLYCIPTAL